MIPLLLALTAQTDLPRLRTVLTNGAVILAERTPTTRASIQLWVAGEGLRDTPRTNGFRHLLEHLIAKGTNRDLDQTLETAGGFLEARTYRDAMVFQVTVASNNIKVGLAAINQILHMGTVTPEDIARECRIIDEEAALRDDTALLGRAAWSAAYASYGLDSFGDADVLTQATPAALLALHRSLFVGGRVALSIVGDIDLDAATVAGRAILSAMPKGPDPIPEAATFRAGTTNADAPGQVRAAEVGSFRDPITVAVLAAGLALASDLPQGFVTYTPSNGPSLILVGTTRPDASLTAPLATDPAMLYNRGRILAARWLRNQLDDPESIASTRGRLLCQSPSLRPETMEENLRTLTYETFLAGLARFRDGRAVIVEGLR